MTTVSRAFLLTDGADGSLTAAAEILQLDVVSVRPASGLPAAIDAHPSARAVIVSTDDPSLLRAIVEHASARRIAVVLAGENEVAYRRAIEFRVDDWYLAPATAEEISWRIRSALARVAAQGFGVSHRMD
jgi:DNA-binding NarL/FixJ family response regulator